MKKLSYARRFHAGKMIAASAVCLMLFSGVSDTLAINTYVRDLKGMALPVQTFNVEHPVIALTFDVGTGGERLGDVLMQLRAQGVKATFFLTGEWVEKNPQTAKQIADSGHEIGQSLYSYREVSELSGAEIQADLAKSEAAWKKAGLPAAHVFRVPHGETNGKVAKIIRAKHEQLISWSVDAAPESEAEAAHVWSEMQAGLQAGDIIRLRADAMSVKALPGLLSSVRKAGYEWKTVSSLQAEVAP